MTDPIKRAAEIGAEHGHAAGTWVFDGNTDAATMRTFLKGIDEGDPAVYDALPGSPLSGEWADGYLLRDLAADIGMAESDEAFDDACDAYEQAWHTAMIDECVRYARAMTDPSPLAASLDTEARYRVNGWPKVAVYVHRLEGGDTVTVVMVGDDAEHTVDASDLAVITEDDYCPECGQIGCKGANLGGSE